MYTEVKTNTWRSLLGSSMVLTLLLFNLAACAESSDTDDDVAPAEPETGVLDEPMASNEAIIDVIQTDGRFSTLATAIESAGLTETLYGEGPFTIFAPTDEAFAALPAGTLDELLLPENRERLREVLLHHVADGSVMAADAGAMSDITPLAGDALTVSAEGETVMVGEATVTEADLEADNGVLHVVNAVLLPAASE